MKMMFINVVALLFVIISLSNGANMNLVSLTSHPMDSACLDGSPYGYYFRAGNESNKWIIHHQGGGWCYNLEECAARAGTALGSSTSWAKTTPSWAGLMDDAPASNPDFYNWNVVVLLYCDGSSFSGSRANPVPYNGKNVYFRGKNNLIAASQDLLAKGLNKATDVIITGCSAGGLATYLHLDYWRSIIPSSTMVRGIADAGWFLDTTSITGKSIYTPEMQTGWALWNSTDGVNADCIAAHKSTNDTWRCIFAEYTYPHIKTPIFMLNSKYDSWQIPNIYGLPCAADLSKCNTTEMNDFLQYGNTFLSTITPLEKNPEDGLFVDACYTHCQSIETSWTKIVVLTADGTKVTANSAFYDWYYGKPETKAVDTCTYPCNPTC